MMNKPGTFECGICERWTSFGDFVVVGRALHGQTPVQFICDRCVERERRPLPPRPVHAKDRISDEMRERNRTGNLSSKHAA